MVAGAERNALECGGRAQERLTVPEGSARGPNIRDIESLRIERTGHPPQRRRLGRLLLALTAMFLAAVVSYIAYTRTIGRPALVQTVIASVRANGQPGVLLSGSGYVVT